MNIVYFVKSISYLKNVEPPILHGVLQLNVNAFCVDKLLPYTLPTTPKSFNTFNDDNTVVLFDNVVKPDTFNDDAKVVLFDNVVNPDTLNDDTNVVSY